MIKTLSSILFVSGVMLVVFALTGQTVAQKRKSSLSQPKLVASVAPVGTALMNEDFVYPTGTLTAVSGGSWVNFSGTAAFIQVSSGSLSYTDYPPSGKGNKIDIVGITTTGEDAYRQFATQSAGSKVYAAFLVNVTNTNGLSANSSTTGDYFAGFLPSTSTTALSARVSIRLGVGAGTYQLGLRATSSNASAVFSSTDLNPGTTYLVVLSYQVVSGNSNDVINMWIDPALNGTEPAADLTETTATTTDNADVSRFFIRQGTAGTPNASIDGIRVGNTWNSVTAPAAVVADTLDFNGDGKTDWALIRASGGLKTWLVDQSSSGGILGAQWGIDLDRDVPADYDGDGKTDIAVWRSNAPGDQSTFYILQSAANTVKIDSFGLNGDDPRTVRDYDGDGKADVSVYRPGANSGDQSYFFYRGTNNNPNGDITYVPWGVNGDIATNGDFDGDGRGDFAVARNTGGYYLFYILLTSGSVDYEYFGVAGDTIIPGDYDGDGQSDLCIVRVINHGGNFYFKQSSNGAIQGPILFGIDTTDKLAPGDYDGDGKTDVGIWRADPDPSQNYFWVRLTGNGTLVTHQWGLPGDQTVGEWNISGGN